MKKIFLLLTAICAVSTAIAQTKITGTVRNAESEPIAGAIVLVKGTDRATVTDGRGHYEIDANADDILVFSSMGMITSEVVIKTDTRRVDIGMLTDAHSLDEVIAVGYGTAKKSDLTGAVVSVKPSDLRNSKIGLVSDALQGLAPGVQVTQGNMKPGADPGIVIRGAGSVNAGTAPLYVVDGIPVQGGLQDIAASDIESIEILKDASSAAIYGSRGSNGVILVTTRKGSPGSTRISVNISGGVQQMLNKYDVMNAQQYYDLITSTGQAYSWTSAELRHLSAGRSTDWQDAIIQSGSYQDYNISIAGGSDKVTHYLGVDYYSQTGTIRNSSFDRLTARYNMDARLSDWVRSGVRFNYIESRLVNINEESDPMYGTMQSAISAQPTAPIYNEDGSYFDGFLNTKSNPVAMVDLLDKITKKSRTVGSAYLEFEPVKNLRIRSDNGLETVIFRVSQYEDGRMGQHYTEGGHANVMSNKKFYWQTENTVSYDFERNRHKLMAMGGFSASKINYEETTADSKKLDPTMKYDNLGAAEEHGPNGSYASASSLASFYARMTYNYDERYLLTFTMRADGSSRFAPGHRWGYFPSLAAAWRISEEPFMKDASRISNLKLRVSVGMLGNQNIGDYAYTALVSQGGSFNNYVFGGSLNTGSVYSSIANPNLTWEKARQLDVGLDFGFFGNRLAGTIDFYYKRTHDLLWTVPLPKESGYISSLTNVGVLDNKGVEISLNTVNVNLRNFQWTTSVNFTYNRNNIVELYDGKQDVNKSLFVGHSLGEYYLLQADGIWQIDEASGAAVFGAEPGNRKIRDIKEDGVINGDDRDFAGQSTPMWYGGMMNTFKYKGIDLSLYITYAGGHKIYNDLTGYLSSYNSWGNMSVDYYNGYWRDDRPSNKYPKPQVGSPYMNGDGTTSMLEKGDYLRIKNLELGYTFPARWTEKVRMSSVRLFISIQNLYTLTGYTGYDVEAWSNKNPYPGARSYIGGLSINF